VTHGIYVVCADTGEVLQVDEASYFVSDSEGIDDNTKFDRVYTHYRRNYLLMPNGGLGTVPAYFDKSLNYFSFAFRIAVLINSSVHKTIFTRIAQKLYHRRKVKNKLYILGAFAIKYCNVEKDYVVQLLLNFTRDVDEETVNKKLSEAMTELDDILNTEVRLSESEKQLLSKTKLQNLNEFKYELLRRFGYTHLMDKFSKVFNYGVAKVAVILLLLRDNRKEEAIQLYKEYPEHNTAFRHFIVEYEYRGKRFIKRLTRERLHSLLFGVLRLRGFKIVL
jgi:hypothetical protein